MTTPPIAFALLLQAPAGGGGSLTPLVFQIVMFVLIIWWFMWRPQQKQRKEHETSLASLKRGDEIVTAGGIVGEVIHIRESGKEGGAKGLTDQVTIKSAESRLIVERGRIARITGATKSSSDTQT
jgi:preprotein translocase subunit YajC